MKEAKTLIQLLNKMELGAFVRAFEAFEDKSSRRNMSSEDIYFFNFIQTTYYSLYDLNKEFEQLSRKVVAEGYLRLQSNKRYEVDGIELSSGVSLEFWYDSDEDYQPHWVPSRIEHGRNGYYIYRLGQDVDIDGMKVRIKR